MKTKKELIDFGNEIYKNIPNLVKMKQKYFFLWQNKPYQQ